MWKCNVIIIRIITVICRNHWIKKNQTNKGLKTIYFLFFIELLPPVTNARFRALYFADHKASLNLRFKDALRWLAGHSGRSSLPRQLRRESSAHFYFPLRLRKRMLADVNYGNNNKQVRQTETDWISYRSRERSRSDWETVGNSYANVHPETLAARAQTCGVRICFCCCRCCRLREFLTFAALRLVFG